MKSKLERTPFVVMPSVNEFIHYFLIFSAYVIVIFGVTGKMNLIEQLFEILAPISHWVAINVPLIDEIARRRPDYPYVKYYLTVIYMVIFVTYFHMIAVTLFIFSKENTINYSVSPLSYYRFLCSTIYSKFNFMANPFCLLACATEEKQSLIVNKGTLVDGLSYYSSRWEVYGIYLFTIYIVYFFLPYADSVVSGHLFVKFGFFVTFFLLATIQIGVIFEVIIFLMAKTIAILKR